MSEFRTILLWIITVANVFLGSLILIKDRRSRINRSFAFFAYCIALWSLAILLFRLLPTGEQAILVIKLSYISAVFIAASFWLFGFAFPERQSMPRYLSVVLGVSTGALAALLLEPGFLTRAAISNPFGTSIVLGLPEYLLFAAYFFTFFFGGLVIIGRKLRRAAGIERIQLSFVFWSVLVAGTGGVAFNLILPSPFLDEWRYIWIGPIFTFLIVLFITYAIAKHHLMNVKVLVAELATIVMVSALAIELFLSQNLTEVAFRVPILLFVGAAGYFLIRGVMREVERREKTEQLARQLEEISEMKSNFVSIASHQLRAPIGGVRGYLSMLREGDYGSLTEKQKDLIEMNMSALDHTLHVIEMFLDVTKMESGKIELSRKPTDLGAVARDVTGQLAGYAKRRGLALRVTVPRRVPTIPLDTEKMRNVVFNLIENAIKYTEEGSVQVSIKVADGALECRVTDTGIGIAPEEVPKLFAKFVRAGGGFKVSHGSGLGLYIIKALVEAHGGTVFVESPGVGKGSTFGFRMPV